jgi:YD repeat-containing protein
MTLNEQGRVVKASVPGLADVQYGYDTRGRLETVTVGEGDESVRVGVTDHLSLLTRHDVGLRPSCLRPWRSVTPLLPLGAAW